jgi:RNA polymerase sigma factor for flagellar operon FliA
MIPPTAYAEQKNNPDKLVEDHIQLVRRLAWHFHGRTGRFAEVDDLLQAGYLGLVDASQSYTAQEGVTFAAYAAIRIRGSIIDFLRRNSNQCRTTISMKQKVRKAQQSLENQLGRAPEASEVAKHLEMDLQEYSEWQSRFEANHVQSLDEIYTDHSILFKDQNPSPEDSTHQSQMKAQLRLALEKLPEREALVLQLYYVEELNVYEVAAILGVTTGRVSQIKKAAIERLRAFIEDSIGGTE